MTKQLIILFIALLPHIVTAQTANAGSDVNVYLSTSTSATLDGSASSGSTFQWREISTDYSSGATITNATSKTATLTGLAKQGAFYFEIAVNGTLKDTMVLRVGSNTAPSNSTLLVNFDMAGTANAINNRADTLNYYASGTLPYNRAFGGDGTRYDLARGRTNGLMVDSLRGKLYSMLEDGYYDNVDGYTRSEIEVPDIVLKIDTTKTYMLEWRGYYPDEVNYLSGGPILNMFQIHGIAVANPFGVSLYPGGDLSIADLGSVDYLAPTRFSNFSNFVNNAHTLRVIINEGAGYSGQPNFFLFSMDGIQKYYRDTGRVGGDSFGDYVKFGSLYDFGSHMVNGDSLSRGRKFRIVTTSYKVYQLNDAVPPCLISIDPDKVVFSPATSTTIAGSVTNTTPASYAWSQVSGTSATIASPTSASTSITGLSEGDYTFKLTTTNSLGVESAAEINVTVKPDPTIALAGYNYDVIVDGVLNGTVSSLRNHDLDNSGYSFFENGFSVNSTPYTGGLPNDRLITSTTGTVYKFQPYNQSNALWLNSGQSGTLTLTTPAQLYGLKVMLTSGGSAINYTVHYSDASTGTGSISVPDWNCAGCSSYAVSGLGRTNASGFESAIWAIYESDITVNQAKTVSSISFTSSGSWTAIFGMSQVFEDIANPPTVTTSGDQTISTPTASVTSTATAASGQSITSYLWTKISGSGSITSPSSQNTGLTGLSGTSVFRITVTQTDGQTAYAELTTTVTAIAPPTVTTSGNQTLITNSTTVFSTPVAASGQTISSVLWTDITGNGSATITSPTSQNTGITGLSVGTHTFRVTVTQSDGQTAHADVSITLTAPPTANAGTDQTITLPTSSVTLSGSGTVASGQTASYEWTKVSGAGTQTITGNTTLTPTISGMTTAGDYVYQLKVIQTDTQFALSTVTVHVNAAPTPTQRPFINLRKPTIVIQIH